MPPRFILLAGPNGSGKSTLADRIDRTGLHDIINPDTIREPDGTLAGVLQAGRIVIQRTAANFAAGASFLLETTLSGNREGRVVAQARQLGYHIDVVFVCLRDPALNIERVRARVLMGGHHVPPEDIIRRYNRSLDNLREILPLTNRAVLFDNSGSGHRHVAHFEDGLLVSAEDNPPAWLARVLS